MVHHLPNVAARPRSSQYPLVSVSDALALLKTKTRNLGIETKSISDADGFVVAEDVLAVEPHPSFRASIMDGYAVICADGSGERRVLGASTAGGDGDGHQPAPSASSGCCTRVSTGAPVPDGYDAVVKVEDTKLLTQTDDEELTVSIEVLPKIGQDIRPVGCDIAAGEIVVPKDTLLSSSEIGILAMVGRKTVNVIRKPKLTVLSTGNEVVDVNSSKPLWFGQIRDSNRPELLSLFRRAGFVSADGGIVADDFGSLCSTLRSAFANCDVLVTSGGVSMGEKDLLKDILVDEFNLTIHFARVFMKPGKPTTFATGVVNERPVVVFALPGNPVSAWVCAHVFVQPALWHMSGRSSFDWPIIKSRASCDMKLDARPEYHRAFFEPAKNDDDPLPIARSTGANQMSSRLTSARSANLLIQLPPRTDGKTVVREGEIVDAIMISL